MPLVIDVAEDVTPHLHAIADSGIKTVFGYMSSINPTGDKCWTPTRVKATAAVGLRIGLVHEGFGGVGGKGISEQDGVRDGSYCRARAIVLGAPPRTCVYFACDQDFSAQQIKELVIPYFTAIRKAFADGRYRVGVYGSGIVCAAVINSGLADLSWQAQSKGWQGYSTWKAKADMLQGPEGKVAGVNADSDEPQGDIGDYVPVFGPVGVPTVAPTIPKPAQPKFAPVKPARLPINHQPQPQPRPFDWFFRFFGGR